ncbi:MAG TPA: peptide-methionine (S)-S-oxide reductase MsrA, partial [Fibrobacteria bacterium]|nr:peptide-methionine (S)-S-oxide reductase MsrA [Fibrobacteria bacterium]
MRRQTNPLLCNLLNAVLPVLLLLAATLFAKPPKEITFTPKPNGIASPAKGKTMKTANATFAGGCFWCIEAAFLDVEGVSSAVSGYSGGHDPKPTYDKVGTGKTGHAEAVQVTYDPAKVSYVTLLEIFWRNIDPADLGGQFADRGSQYRPVIFYHNAEQKKLAEESRARLEATGKFGKIGVPVEAFTSFFPAEEYHQKYCKLNPDRYKRYKVGSGRAGFIESAWGHDPLKPVPPTPKTDGVEDGGAPAASVDSPEDRRAACDLSALSDSELRARLSPEQYEIARKNGTERPFANAFWDNHREGL